MHKEIKMIKPCCQICVWEHTVSCLYPRCRYYNNLNWEIDYEDYKKELQAVEEYSKRIDRTS